MKLLNNRFIPITNQFGFIEAPLSKVRFSFSSWIYEQCNPIIEKKLEGSLQEQLINLQPLTWPINSYLWIETHSLWTALFTNGLYGADIYGTLSK